MGKTNVAENRRRVKADLDSNLRNEDWGSLEKNLVLAMQSGLSVKVRRKAAIELGNHFIKEGDYRRAFAVYENSMAVAPDQERREVAPLEIVEGIFKEYSDDSQNTISCS